MTPPPLLAVRNLRVAFGSSDAVHEVVRGVSFMVARGETLAIVGESGSGKTATALSIIGLLPGDAECRGSVVFDGRELFQLPSPDRRRLRGEKIAMIFQEPMTSLNPVLSIGQQLTEGPIAHRRANPGEARTLALAMLTRVGITDPEARLRQYPHELSGGMRQRVMIAMAMAMRPLLLIADEPTTALDVTVQAQILDLMRALIAETGTSLILITHDMGVVAEMADRVVVMHDGEVVEEAATGSLFATPIRPYTKALLAAVPRIESSTIAEPAETKRQQPILAAEAVSKTFRTGGLSPFAARRGTRALDNISLSIMPGESVALVGESGSGKSTLGRAFARLVDIDHGAIRIDGKELSGLTGRTLRQARSQIQLVFQDPYASLDPRFTVERTIAEPIVIHGLAGRRDAIERVQALLRRVGLDAASARRYPHQFSGGQRQRIAIARALAAEPRIIVADEPTSSLDVSIQAQVLDLLAELRDEKGIALLFISHDLAVVARIASRIAVMRAGRIVELGPTRVVLGEPRHPYTRALIAAAPSPDPTRRRRGPLASPQEYRAGDLVEVATGHWVAS
jgi:ABC-type glutathione transport system ATPase component